MQTLMVPLVLVAAAAPAAGSASLEVQNIWDFIVKGGMMMIPLGLCSLIALTLIIERFISLSRKVVIPPKFLPGLKKLLNGHAPDRKKALEYCRENPSPVANVFAAGVRKADGSIEAVERYIKEAGEREELKLRKNLRGLAVIASVTPLMGLLGTIFGMITAFQTVAVSAEALGKTEMLAGGIYSAMITTAAGLSIAIPALICYHWINSKIDRLLMDIDQMTVSFIEEFVETGSVGAGPAAASMGNHDGHKESQPPLVTVGARDKSREAMAHDQAERVQ